MDHYEVAPTGTMEAAKDMALALEAILVEWQHSDAHYKYLYTQEQPAYIARIEAALAKYEATQGD